MIDIFATSDRNAKRWFLRGCILLILLAVGMQLVHVHADNDFSGSICLACVSAHTSVPVARICFSAFLVALTLVVILGESTPGTCEPLLKYFIRRPPSL
jgi:hypothetical protein